MINKNTFIIILFSIMAISNCQKVESQNPNIRFIFDLLDENGKATTEFKEGENIMFRFLIINGSDKTLHLERNSILSKDFLRVYGVNAFGGKITDDFGKPYENTCTMQNGFFIDPRDTLKVQISWIPLSNQHFTCILKDENVPLAKGNYLTEFSSTFTFNDNEHRFDLDRSFKIEFKIF